MMSHGEGVVNPPPMKVTCPDLKGVKSTKIPLITCSIFPILRHEGISKEIFTS